MKEPTWILDDVVQAVHSILLAEHGGGTGIRDEALLDSALARAKQKYTYEPEASIFELAAAYCFGIAKNHPFVDGNKRTAAITCELFLNLNGRVFTIGETEKYPHYLALAAGEHSEESFADWLRTVTESE